jgi:hypothetical protein
MKNKNEKQQRLNSDDQNNIKSEIFEQTVSNQSHSPQYNCSNKVNSVFLTPSSVSVQTNSINIKESLTNNTTNESHPLSMQLPLASSFNLHSTLANNNSNLELITSSGSSCGSPSPPNSSFNSFCSQSSTQTTPHWTSTTFNPYFTTNNDQFQFNNNNNNGLYKMNIQHPRLASSPSPYYSHQDQPIFPIQRNHHHYNEPFYRDTQQQPHSSYSNCYPTINQHFSNSDNFNLFSSN